MDQQLALFDYASLDTDTRSFVQEKTGEIHKSLKRTAEEIIKVGKNLIAVKEAIGHGNYENWLRSEFTMSIRQARNFMYVADKFGSKSAKFADLPLSVIYELASPSMPDTVIEMVEREEIAATLPAIREAKQQLTPPIQETVSLSDIFTSPKLPLQSNRETYLSEHPYNADVISTKIQTPPQEATHLMQIMSSSDSPEWYTPAHIIDRVLHLFGAIDLDPCSNSHETPNVPARTIYTREDNGLSKTWAGKVYMNPPYGREIGEWTEKLEQEFRCGNVQEAIALVPGRIDTAWFQPLYAHLICTIKGRLSFSQAESGAPFPSVVIYMGVRREAFIAAFKSAGAILERVA